MDGSRVLGVDGSRGEAERLVAMGFECVGAVGHEGGAAASRDAHTQVYRPTPGSGSRTIHGRQRSYMLALELEKSV